MKTLIIPTILFIISIVVNGISLIQPNSDKFASLAVIILLISIGLAITAVYMDIKKEVNYSNFYYIINDPILSGYF